MTRTYKIIVHVSGPRFDDFIIQADRVIFKDGRVWFYDHLGSEPIASVNMQHLIYMRTLDPAILPPNFGVPPRTNDTMVQFGTRDPIADAAREAGDKFAAGVAKLAKGGIVSGPLTDAKGELGANW